MAIRLEDLPLRAQQQAVAKLQQEQLRKQKRAAPKYHNEETEHLGIRFASRKEARRYEVLLARLHAGEIRNLRLQQDFTLQEAYTTPEGERVRPSATRRTSATRSGFTAAFCTTTAPAPATCAGSRWWRT